MEKKLLVAVDGSKSSRYVLNYIRHAAQVIRDLTVVLCHVRPQISGYLAQEAITSFTARQDLDLVTRRQQKASDELLASLKKELVDQGMPGASVETLSRPYGKGVSAEILNWALEKHLDAIVTGRRGLSGIQAFYLGSVSNNLVEQGKVTPTWIIGDKVCLRNILFAVDGSENSLRALDHLAFMLNGASDFRVTLFHVRPKFRDFCEIDFSPEEEKSIADHMSRGNQACIENFYGKARDILSRAGITEGEYTVKVADVLMNIGATIVEEARSGDYDTLVMGRRGEKGQLFTGSTTRYVLNQIAHRAVWIVP
jgi:nucleotide-binding universal stress UspA family protein